MQYQIIQKLRCPCRVIDVKLRTNRANGSKFVVAKLGKYDTGEFLRSVILREATYRHIVSELQTKKYHSIESIEIRPQNNVYHILQWDDIDRGICTREHLYEIQRDNEGNPVMFSQIVIFANLDKLNRITINEVLDKEYIEVDSPIVQNYLNFNNREYYLLRQETKWKYEQEQHEETKSDQYEAHENRRFFSLDKSEEEKRISALENGEVELTFNINKPCNIKRLFCTFANKMYTIKKICSGISKLMWSVVG